jgi:4-amino-4-deoxy-L-arabinose transferase-like glycosyltransferase
MMPAKSALPLLTCYGLFAAATVVYIAGLFIPVMEVDAAQYAAISREMLENKSYLQVYNRGGDYLDKPPLIFWLSVLSFKIFGVGTVAYKLPSFLFTVFGTYATYRLGKKLYDQSTGLMAALILYTCQAFFLFNQDVRTDTLLTACVIIATWQLVLHAETGRFVHLAAGFSGVALAMMAKGPIGAIVPGAALFIHLVMKREWKKIFRWQWLAGIPIMLALLSPMLYGLFRQFGNEGPRFFFWTQSFGRITGENVWKNEAGYFYFTHVFGWSMLPWSALSVAAVFYSLFQLFRKRFNAGALPEFYTLGGTLLPFVALSFSQYKLPHYIYVVFPLVAIHTAAFLRFRVNENKNRLKAFGFVQLFVVAGIVMLTLLICLQFFPLHNGWLWLPSAAALAVALWYWFKPAGLFSKIVFPSALAALLINWLLNLHAYPALLKYQADTQLAKVVISEKLVGQEVFFSNYSSYSFEFEIRKTAGYLSHDEINERVMEGKKFLVMGREDLYAAVEKYQWKPVKIFSAGDFHVSQLNTRFLQPETRAGELTRVYVLVF